jgi:trans-o-hydroxybenzylidenepyruvate hydratase-aldolase
LAVTARAVDALVRAGVDGILAMGTFGEGATLTWEEKRKFTQVVVDTVAGRVPFFTGTTSLSTRETVRQTRAALDIGVDGTMLGLPMWCQADTPTAVQFYRDVAEGCPEAAICIYANREAFKYEFPRPFWAQVSEIPQVVSAKYLDIGPLSQTCVSPKGAFVSSRPTAISTPPRALIQRTAPRFGPVALAAVRSWSRACATR